MTRCAVFPLTVLFPELLIGTSELARWLRSGPSYRRGLNQEQHMAWFRRACFSSWAPLAWASLHITVGSLCVMSCHRDNPETTHGHPHVHRCVPHWSLCPFSFSPLPNFGQCCANVASFKHTLMLCFSDGCRRTKWVRSVPAPER